MGFACVTSGRECTGCMACQPESEAPVCPVCGKESDVFYLDKANDIIGCDECIAAQDAWEVAESA